MKRALFLVIVVSFLVGACGTNTVVPSMTPVATATPTPTSTATVTSEPISVKLWQDSLSVEYTPEKDSSYSFVDQSGGRTILRVPVGNASINVLLSAVDNDIVSARVINASGTVDMTISDFEIEPLGFIPPGYPEGTNLSTFTTQAVNIPVSYGDVLTVSFAGADGSSGTVTYDLHPSIQDAVGANTQALGMHGAVVNLGPNPAFGDLFNWDTYLQDHSVTVYISQDGRILQRNVPVEFYQGMPFAELVDFSLRLGVPIDVAINISQGENDHTAQLSSPGLTEYPPFLMPMFHQSDLDAYGVPLDIIDIHGTEPGEPFPYYAVDFCGDMCRPGDAADITGLPIYTPGDIWLIRTYGVLAQETLGPEENINFYGYMPDVGVVLFACHVRPGPMLNRLVTSKGWDLQRSVSGYPGSDRYLIPAGSHFLNVGDSGANHETQVDHLHLAAQVPYPFVEDLVPIPESATGWNTSTGISHGEPAYFGICPGPEYGVGPCPELLPEGTLFVNMNHFMVTGSWIDSSK